MNWKRGISTTVSLLLSLILLGSGSAEARPRVAFLTLGDQQMDAVYVAAFVEGLRRLGYVEGRNLDIDYRYTAGAVERLKPLAQELVALHPDVLVGSEPSAARALKEIAPASPIVCLALTDALIPDLIASYARPGSNVTGVAHSVESLTGKLVEVVMDIIPATVRIGFLSNPTGASMAFFAQRVEAAAHARAIAVLTEQAADSSELSSAFNRFSTQKVQSVIVPANGLFRTQSQQIAQLALDSRLPTISSERGYVEAGLLASYGVNVAETYRRGASYVDRILKGAKASDLPIEFPTRVDLTINLKTAKALGIDIPPSLVTRADEVIE
jgi:putative tryptophan/tyrosine transport system substrate-binding protein